jgi:hypothetical protein
MASLTVTSNTPPHKRQRIEESKIDVGMADAKLMPIDVAPELGVAIGYVGLPLCVC